MTEIERLQMNANQANSDFMAIKNKIVEKGVDIADGTRTAEYASKVDGVYEKGYEQGYKEAWRYVGQLNNSFANVTFPDGYEMSISVPSRNSANLNQVIYSAKGLRKLTIKDSPIADVKSYFGFGFCTSIEEIDLSNFVQGGGAVVVTDASYLFYGDTKLRVILGELDFSTGVGLSTVFTTCNALEEVRLGGVLEQNGFDIHWSPKLSKASITSIIEHLSTTTSGLTVTLSKTAVENAFGSTESTEWTTLISSKSNWTISLVQGV